MSDQPDSTYRPFLVRVVDIRGNAIQYSFKPLSDAALYRIAQQPSECRFNEHGPFYQESGVIICAKCSWTFAPIEQVWPEVNDG